jgi:arylsulfatase A-like enzyme
MMRKLLIGVTVFSMASGVWAVDASRPDKKPNIVVIFSDDHAYGAIGYNNPEVKTPNMDRLAAEGIRFDRTFVASPICAASRASIMTGAYPQQHGVVGLHTGRWSSHSNRFTILSEALNKAGYLTAFYGKSHLGDPKAYGFTQGSEKQGANDEWLPEATRSFFKQEAGAKRPFLLWLAPRKPHLPLRPPQRFLDLYKAEALTLSPNWREAPPQESLYNQGTKDIAFRDSGHSVTKNVTAGPPRTAGQIREFMQYYYGMVSYLDEHVGLVVEELKANGLYENTIVIYTSDNGYFLGNHGLGNKLTMHEESVRVPMFVHSPLLRNKGAVCNALVSGLDLYPTILELAGAMVPETAMGKSLLPLLENPAATLHEYVVSESSGPPETRLGTGHRMARTDRYKYILTTHDEEAFFDLREDPYEKNNLIGSEPLKNEVERHRALLCEWRQRVGEKRQAYPLKGKNGMSKGCLEPTGVRTK